MASETPTAKNADEIPAADQRRLALIWEVTRGIIAMAVTLTTLAVAAVTVIQGKAPETAFSLLSNTFFLVVGLYFGRTSPGKPHGSPYRNGDR